MPTSFAATYLPFILILTFFICFMCSINMLVLTSEYNLLVALRTLTVFKMKTAYEWTQWQQYMIIITSVQKQTALQLFSTCMNILNGCISHFFDLCIGCISFIQAAPWIACNECISWKPPPPPIYSKKVKLHITDKQLMQYDINLIISQLMQPSDKDCS